MSSISDNLQSRETAPLIGRIIFGTTANEAYDSVRIELSLGAVQIVALTSSNDLPLKPRKSIDLVYSRLCAGEESRLSEFWQVTDEHVHGGKMVVAQHARQSTQACTPNRLVSVATLTPGTIRVPASRSPWRM